MWTDSPVTASPSGLVRLLEGLWTDAARIDLAIADPGWLAGTLSREGSSCPRVRAVVSTPRGEGQQGWSVWLAAEPPSPEMILAYLDGVGFPALAVVLGGKPDDPFAIVQRRPLVLRRLLERFELMLLQAEALTVHLGAGSPGTRQQMAVRIREEPPGHGLAGDARGAPASEPDTGASLDVGATVEPQTATPEAVYRLVLGRHFGEIHTVASEQLASHQRSALERALAILDRYGGVIVADSVGLGKTFVGLGLLRATRSQSQRALVITPASLRAQWRSHLGYLRGADAPDSRSIDPDDRQLTLQEASGMVDLISMESLGRSSFDPERFENIDFVLVDEAHNFRNPSTNRYRSLARIARHARVALLTATPVNNSLLDLSALIDLFAAPGAFRHLGIGNYRSCFRRDVVDEDVRRVVAACVVRRTRRFLRAHYGPVTVSDPETGEPCELRFPKRLPPRVVPYDLSGTYGQLLGDLENWLASLRFPSLGGDAANPSNEGGAEALVKIILLKRLESSVQAFRRSVVQQLAWCDTALRALASGRVLTRPDYRASFRGPADDPGSQLALFELMLPPASVDAEALHRFREDLQRDRDMLADIHRRLSVLVGAGADRKLEALRRIVTENLLGEKIIIFTEFRDTARYLYSQLRDLPHLALIDSGGARLGLEAAARHEVITRFSPVSNNAPEPPAIERVDTLIATDVLSEGLNLQDASLVVSYDLPWNPVRLMQRVGRVDRLGALAEVVEPLCFVPADQLDRLLGLMDRLQRKVATIGATFGLDQIILPGFGAAEVNETDRVRRLLTDPQEMDRLDDELEGPPDPEELAYIDHVRLSNDTETGLPDPPAAAVASMANAIDGRSTPKVIGYWRLRWSHRARGLWTVYDPETRCVTEDSLAAVQGFRLAIEPGAAASAQPDGATARDTGALIREARLAFARFAQAELARIEAARIAGDQLIPSLPQCRIAAWLARILEREELRLDYDTRRRIDRLATGLARRFTAQDERALSTLAGDLPDQPDHSTLARLEQIIEANERERTAPGSAEEVGALLVTRQPSRADH